MDSSPSPRSALVGARASTVGGSLTEVVNSAPDERLRKALTAAVAGVEEAIGPLIVLGAAGEDGSESAEVVRAAAAIGLLEGAQRAETSVHGLDAAEADQAAGPNDIVAAFASAWLRARSTELAAELGEAALAQQSEALVGIARGWIEEAADLYDAGRSPERCLEVARSTRGSLCSLASAHGGLAAGLPDDEVEALARFGATVGTAAVACDQAVALVPTLVPSPGRAGEALQRGVYGLPVAYALEAEPKLAASLGGAIRREDLDELVARIRGAGGLTRTAALCRRLSSEAVAEIERLDAGAELTGLATRTAERCEQAALA